MAYEYTRQHSTRTELNYPNPYQKPNYDQQSSTDDSQTQTPPPQYDQSTFEDEWFELSSMALAFAKAIGNPTKPELKPHTPPKPISELGFDISPTLRAKLKSFADDDFEEVPE